LEKHGLKWGFPKKKNPFTEKKKKKEKFGRVGKRLPVFKLKKPDARDNMQTKRGGWGERVQNFS